MNNLSATITERREPTIAAGKRSDGRCLVVHDDLELPLRLGTLVRRAIPKLDADCVSCASFDALHPGASRHLRRAAAHRRVQPARQHGRSAGAARARPRELAPHLPIFVFARGGDERNAARTIKLGANDYWPIHSVIIGEVGAVAAAA